VPSHEGEPPIAMSPGGRVGVSLSLEASESSASFSVSLDDRPVVTAAGLGVALAGTGLDLMAGLEWMGSSDRIIDETYAMATGKRRARRNHCREVEHRFRNRSGALLSIIFRIFDDGVAFRYVTSNPTASNLTQEASGYRVDDIACVWSAPYRSNDEHVFERTKGTGELQGRPLSFPVLIESSSGDWFLLTEADVSDHRLSVGEFETDTLRFAAAPDHDGDDGVPPAYRSPWRVMILGDTLAAIVESCIVDDLAPPGPDEPPAWIEPGVASFPWWGDNEANSDPATLKRYIDLSAAMGWRFVEFDVALIGSANSAVDEWKSTPWIADVVDHANGKGVKCIGWDDFDNLDTAAKREDVFSRYRELGMAGCKVDFVESYTRSARRIVEDIIKDAEHYELPVSFHGAQSPRGFARAYPHVLTFEAVFGAEHYLEVNKSVGVPPSHNCTLPFTRNVLGSMDYTPVAFTTDLRTTSMAHELALAVVFESGWQVLCDVPQAYLESPARPFLTGLPATWDETRLLAGYPGELCCIARRDGPDWYVAGISATKARTVSIDLSPILAGERAVTMYQDAVGDGDGNGLEALEAEVSGARPLVVSLRDNGGFAFMLAS